MNHQVDTDELGTVPFHFEDFHANSAQLKWVIVEVRWHSSSWKDQNKA